MPVLKIIILDFNILKNKYKIIYIKKKLMNVFYLSFNTIKSFVDLELQGFTKCNRHKKLFQLDLYK